jgi:hypothetical protein
MKNTTRRQLLGTAGLSLAAFGLGTQIEARDATEKSRLPDCSGTPKEVAESGNGWKYHSIDPRRTADDSYTLFAEGACHYASFRAIVTNVANAFLMTGNTNDALLAKTYLAFPFYMMVYGQAGLAYYGSLCGALNGCAAALSLFVPNKEDKFAMVRDLAAYYEETPMPIYVPKVDHYPGKMPPNAAKSILCHLSLDQWIKNSKTTLEGYTRVERCIRVTCDMVIKTVELLNDYHTDCTKALGAIAPIPAETRSCIQCHSDTQGRYDSLVRMNCTACHSDPQPNRLCLRKEVSK